MRITGHLWRSRFGSVVMDEEHLMHSVRYVSLNPVSAMLGERAEDWPWSSVVAHLNSKDDGFVKVSPVLERYGNFQRFLDMRRLNLTNVCDNRRQLVAHWGA